jgi:hypothetical protein
MQQGMLFETEKKGGGEMITPEQLAEAKAMIAAGAANGNGGGAATPPGWSAAAAPAPVATFGFQQPQMMGAPAPERVLIPIKIPTPNGGSLRVYLQFGGELANPQVLMQALATLAGQGFPLDVYVPKQNWGGGGFRGNGGGGGWGGNRGGW